MPDTMPVMLVVLLQRLFFSLLLASLFLVTDSCVAAPTSSPIKTTAARFQEDLGRLVGATHHTLPPLMFIRVR